MSALRDSFIKEELYEPPGNLTKSSNDTHIALYTSRGLPAVRRTGTAAGVSMSDVTTSSGGKFVKRDGKWMYRQKDGSYAKDCLLKINGKTYCFSKMATDSLAGRNLKGIIITLESSPRDTSTGCAG